MVSSPTPSEVDKQAEPLHTRWQIIVLAKCGVTVVFFFCLYVSNNPDQVSCKDCVETVIRSLVSHVFKITKT